MNNMKYREWNFGTLGLFVILVMGINVPVLVFEHYKGRNEMHFVQESPVEAR